MRLTSEVMLLQTQHADKSQASMRKRLCAVSICQTTFEISNVHFVGGRLSNVHMGSKKHAKDCRQSTLLSLRQYPHGISSIDRIASVWRLIATVNQTGSDPQFYGNHDQNNTLSAILAPNDDALH